MTRESPGPEPCPRERIDQLGADLPAGRYLVPLTGSSMEPILSDGDKLLVDVPARDPLFGDVLIVRHRSVHYVHRLVGRHRGRLRTKGDGRGHLDGWLAEPDEVLGLVVGASHGGRWRDLRGTRCRLLCIVTGLWSAACGHLYRVALRLDRAIGQGDATGAGIGTGGRRASSEMAPDREKGAEEGTGEGAGRASHIGSTGAETEGFCSDIARLNAFGFRLLELFHERALDHECCQSALTGASASDAASTQRSGRTEARGVRPALADAGHDEPGAGSAGDLGRAI